MWKSTGNTFFYVLSGENKRRNSLRWRKYIEKWTNSKKVKNTHNGRKCTLYERYCIHQRAYGCYNAFIRNTKKQFIKGGYFYEEKSTYRITYRCNTAHIMCIFDHYACFFLFHVSFIFSIFSSCLRSIWFFFTKAHIFHLFFCTFSQTLYVYFVNYSHSFLLFLCKKDFLWIPGFQGMEHLFRKVQK